MSRIEYSAFSQASPGKYWRVGILPLSLPSSILPLSLPSNPSPSFGQWGFFPVFPHLPESSLNSPIISDPSVITGAVPQSATQLPEGKQGRLGGGARRR